MSNIDKHSVTAKTKELASLMVERFSMNPVSCKLLNESWEKEFPDEVAIAKRMLALLDEMEARCAVLAADNARLKSAIDATIEWQQSTDPDNVESVRMLVDVKTPAPEGILADVMAQGVEMFAQKCDLKAAQSLASDVSDNWKLLGLHASYFAAQLRKGVQS